MGGCIKKTQEMHEGASEFVLHKIETFMGNIGKFTVRRPCATVALSLLLAIFVSGGFAFLESETEADNLFAPERTQAMKDKGKYEDTFGAKQDVKYMLDTFFYSDSQNVYTQEVMEKYEIFYNALLELQSSDGGRDYNYTSLCYRASATGACTSSGPFSTFRLDASNFRDPEIYNSYLQTDPLTYSSYPTLTAIADPVWQSNELQEAKAIKLTMGTYNYPSNHADHERLKDANEQFFRDFIDMCADLEDQLEFDGVKFAYYTEVSVDLESAESIGGDIILFVVAIQIICLLAIVFNYRTQWVENKMWVAVPGLLSTCLAIPCAFGILGWFGVRTNSVVAVAPFLLLGIGVDDMFVLVRAFDLTPKELSVEKRIVMTMEGAGVGIFFTSVTDFLAFMIGFSSPYPAIRAFCLYSGSGVLFDFIFQCTMFMAFLTAQAERERDGKFVSFPWCCCRISPDQDNHNAAEDADNPESPSTPKELRMMRQSSFRLNGNINSHFDPKEENSAFTAYVHFLLKPQISIAVAVTFCVWIAMACYGISTIPVGQKVQDLAPEGSYLRDYLNGNDDYFDEVGRIVDFVMKDSLNYWEPGVQSNVANMIAAAEADECGTAGTGQSWLGSFTSYSNSSSIDISTESLFMAELRTWLTVSGGNGGARFARDLLFEDPVAQDVIVHSKVAVNMRPPNSDEISMESQAKCLGPLGDIAEDAGLGDTFIYWGTAIYAASVNVILKETLLTLTYAAVAAFCICLVLIPSLKLSLIVMVVVVAILAGVIGYLSFWGYRVDTVISINLVMTIGFAVDNAAHIAHAYFHSVSKTRPNKVADALNLVGIPIIMGDLSTVLALFPLVFSKSIIFQSFFACIFLVMVFGAASALLFLPVILCYLGPEADHSEAMENMRMNTDRTKQQIDMAGTDANL